MDLASIAMAKGDQVIALRENPVQKDHASWIHPAVRDLMDDLKMPWTELKAVAVSAGPGSYTGLRVGMATAKGICFSLGLPLITESTLLLLALDVRHIAATVGASLICPMIDARREEVFMAVYDRELKQIWPPRAAILEPRFMEELLDQHRILFTGSGSVKWKANTAHGNALFSGHGPLAPALAGAASSKYTRAEFTDLSHSEPVYIKEFYTHTKK